MDEKQEEEDFLEIHVLSQPSFLGIDHVSAVLRQVVKGPLYKTRLVLEFAILGSGFGAFDACVNAASVCFIQGGVPLFDTFASATVDGDCSATAVCGLFTDRVIHVQCQGGVERATLEKVREQCRTNALEIKSHIVSGLE